MPEIQIPAEIVLCELESTAERQDVFSNHFHHNCIGYYFMNEIKRIKKN